MKSKKNLTAILTAIILAVVLVAALVIPTGATGITPELSIDYCNLSFRNTVCIKYAVATNVPDVELLIWSEPQTNYVAGTQDLALKDVGEEIIDQKTYTVFDYTGINAKQMTDVIYARAYVKKGGEEYYSNVNKYSVLDYAYSKLGKTDTATTSENLKEMLLGMLSYGAGAQKYFEYKVDRLATMDFYQLKLTEGVFEDGSNHGLYLAGEKVKISAPKTNESGDNFSHWEDANGNKVGTSAEYTVTIGSSNAVYTPVYASYSEGLEFDSNGDGTCYVVGMGDCTDKEVNIPPVSPSGDKVIGIDNSAFADSSITSITIPDTIEEIGRKAFNNCTSLTDVYYGGTSAQWAEVNVSSGNDALENATLHVKEEPVTKYTVTFTDYDGKVLKTEQVVKGAAATAPEAPVRSGYAFVGWDKAFNNVTANITVIAQYKKNDATFAIAIDEVNASAGATNVEVPVKIRNNKGILGATIQFSYDSKLILTGYKAGSADFPSLDVQAPGKYVSPCNFVFDATELKAEDRDDGTLITLIFSVAENAVSGEKLNINVDYNQYDVFDESFSYVAPAKEGGAIVVK